MKTDGVSDNDKLAMIFNTIYTHKYLWLLSTVKPAEFFCFLMAAVQQSLKEISVKRDAFLKKINVNLLI